MKYSIIIPTLNGKKDLMKSSERLLKLVDNSNFEIILIDSESEDGTVEWAELQGIKVIEIKRSEFNHGGTRNKAANYAVGEIIIFLTQDAILYNDDSIENILLAFKDKTIGMAYGRQIPHLDADIHGSFARMHNYPDVSMVKRYKDRKELGIKTVFCSNSFAAYRKDVLVSIGGFPDNVILGEDTYVCAKMLMNDYKCAYVANAVVYHSHNYSIKEEFKRYFDIGVFHYRENWIINDFDNTEGEGLNFVLSQAKYLMKKKKYHLIVDLVLRNGSKFIGYKMGKKEHKLSINTKRKLSMHKGYWS
ncbi:glycosyltransferase family 2 protein [Shouchella lehensis]|uniref:Glycosyltransferase n=1 Tax=Shouchella lehensis TaxID=300825 RepID=A0A4Y7WET6_9BACI|nr:glycosyltransferase family 2 protein [Shouchella lehensis]MBG9785019.1 hypothetical protein [Shouchella lehensis]TES46442.1 glycosyltransferase [Shouchella lehensis]